MTKLNTFLKDIAEEQTSTELFNPFNEVCPLHDKPNASQIRLRNLELLLNTHLNLGTKIIWLFEAPSYQGARRSGAPFVNEGMFDEISAILGITKNFQKATITEAKTAMTSKLAWKVARELNQKPLIWESLLFHPHKKNNPMTNRRPTKKELLEHKHFLEDILVLLKPEIIVAVGRVAEESTKIMGIDAQYVRHPAQGGFKEFREQMKTSPRP